MIRFLTMPREYSAHGASGRLGDLPQLLHPGDDVVHRLDPWRELHVKEKLRRPEFSRGDDVVGNHRQLRSTISFTAGSAIVGGRTRPSDTRITYGPRFGLHTSGFG